MRRARLEAIDPFDTLSFYTGDPPTLDYTLRYRGVHWQDYLVGNPVFGDIYLSRYGGVPHWRHYNASNNWENLSQTRVDRMGWIGYFPTENEARDHVTRQGQRMIYLDASNDPVFATMLGDWMPAEQYEPVWTPLISTEYVPIGGGTDNTADIIFHRIAQDSTMTVTRFGGNDYLEGFAIGPPAHSSTDPEVPNNNAIGLDWIARARPIDPAPANWQNKCIVRLVRDDDNHRKWDGAKVRWFGFEHDLHYDRTTTSNAITYETYRTTEDVHDPTPGDEIAWNIEDVDASHLGDGVLLSTPWVFHHPTPGDDPATDSTVATIDHSLASTTNVMTTTGHTDGTRHDHKHA